MRAGENLTVKQAPENPVPAEVLASAIVEIGEAAKRLAAARLNRRAIVVLLNDMTGVPKVRINLVLNGLEELEATYLKPAGRRRR